MVVRRKYQEPVLSVDYHHGYYGQGPGQVSGRGEPHKGYGGRPQRFHEHYAHDDEFYYEEQDYELEEEDDYAEEVESRMLASNPRRGDFEKHMAKQTYFNQPLQQ